MENFVFNPFTCELDMLGGSPPTYLKTARITTSGDLEIKTNTGETLTFSGGDGGGTSDEYWEEL